MITVSDILDKHVGSWQLEVFTVLGMLFFVAVSILTLIAVVAFILSWYERLLLFFEYGAHSEKIRLAKLQKKLDRKQRHNGDIR